jgi:predicted permease
MRGLLRGARRLTRRSELTCILLLTLGIGGVTTIFSLLDSVALRPLPYDRPEQLVQIAAGVAGLRDLKEVSWTKFRFLAEQSRDLAAVASYYQGQFALTEKGHPELLAGARVSESFLRVLQVRPLLGRDFLSSEQQPGGPAVALLSHGFWQRRFGGDPSVVGRSVSIEGAPTTVIGVLPEDVRFPFAEVQVWLPRPGEAEFVSRRWIEQGAGYLQVIARLRPASDLRQARLEADRLSSAYREAQPGQLDVAHSLVLTPLSDSLVGTTRDTLAVLLGAVFLVLAIASANAANLLLVEGLRRRQEMAVRLALGASRRALLLERVAEIGWIAAVAGVLGSAVAFLGVKMLVTLQPADLPRIAEAAVSGKALAFALGTTALTAFLSGLAPAMRLLRDAPVSLLGSAERNVTTSRGVRRVQGLLVAGEIALALVLLSATGLLLRSLARVDGIEVGFDPGQLFSVQVTLPPAAHPGLAAQNAFFEELVGQVRALPGVSAAALVEYPPGGGAPHTRAVAEGQEAIPSERQMLVHRALVSEGYFQALGVRLLRGRDFDPRTPPDAPLTAVINRSFERQCFPGQDALGKRIRLRTGALAEVIGVVEDTQQNALEQAKEPMIFLPRRQAGADLSPPNFMHLLVRTSLPGAGLTQALRRLVDRLDPAQPMADVTPVAQLFASATARRTLTARLFGAFSALALALGVLGVYAVASHAVIERRREIAVRMALGATERRVVLEVLGLAARWIVPGLLIGVPGALLVGRALASELFEAQPADALQIALASLIMTIVGFVAALLPARRAAREHPAPSLHQS